MDAPHASKCWSASATKPARRWSGCGRSLRTTTPRRKPAGDGAARDRGGAWAHTWARRALRGWRVASATLRSPRSARRARCSATPSAMPVETERDACCDDRSRSLHAGRMHGADECARDPRRGGDGRCPMTARVYRADDPRRTGSAPSRGRGVARARAPCGCSGTRAAGPRPRRSRRAGDRLRPPRSCRPRAAARGAARVWMGHARDPVTARPTSSPGSEEAVTLRWYRRTTRSPTLTAGGWRRSSTRSCGTSRRSRSARRGRRWGCARATRAAPARAPGDAGRGGPARRMRRAIAAW